MIQREVVHGLLIPGVHDASKAAFSVPGMEELKTSLYPDFKSILDHFSPSASFMYLLEKPSTNVDKRAKYIYGKMFEELVFTWMQESAGLLQGTLLSPSSTDALFHEVKEFSPDGVLVNTEDDTVTVNSFFEYKLNSESEIEESISQLARTNWFIGINGGVARHLRKAVTVDEIGEPIQTIVVGPHAKNFLICPSDRDMSALASYATQLKAPFTHQFVVDVVKAATMDAFSKEQK